MKTTPIAGETDPPILQNIQLLRIILALVLVITHGLTQLHDVPSSRTDLVPVVPVFLFFGGYYMFASYKRNPAPLRFLLTRYVKLFPILLISTIATLGLLLYGGGSSVLKAVQPDIPRWLFAQFTVLQTYYPPSFEQTGIPARNGVLWFISVIFFCYGSLPVIATVERVFPRFLWVVFGASLIFFLWRMGAFGTGDDTKKAVLAALGENRETLGDNLKSTLLATGARTLTMMWMFYAGCLARRYQTVLFDRVWRVIVIAGSGLITFGLHLSGVTEGLDLRICSPWYFPFYVGIWLLASEWLPDIERLPNISIGLFIWHIPVSHFLNIAQMANLGIAFAATFALSLTTYYLVEKPFANFVGARLVRSV